MPVRKPAENSAEKPQWHTTSIHMNPLNTGYENPVRCNAEYYSAVHDDEDDGAGGGGGVASKRPADPGANSVTESETNAVAVDGDKYVAPQPNITARCAYFRNDRSGRKRCKAKAANDRPWCLRHTCEHCGDACKPSDEKFCDRCATIDTPPTKRVLTFQNDYIDFDEPNGITAI